MQILELVIAFFCFPDVSIDFFDDTKFSSSDLLTLKKKKKVAVPGLVALLSNPQWAVLLN